jgi:Flp pilus assembly protein TadD
MGSETKVDVQSTKRGGEKRKEQGSARSLAPAERELLCLAGERLIREGQYADAIQIFELLVEADPVNAAYHRRLGVCRAQAGMLASAETALDRAIELDDLDGEALVSRAWVRVRRGNKAGALDDLKAAGPTPMGSESELARRVEQSLRDGQLPC